MTFFISGGAKCGKSNLAQNLGTNAVIPLIGLESKTKVCINSVHSLFL